LKFFSRFRNLTLLVLSVSSCFAANITGTVTNKTTNKPSSGDDVVLIKLAATMEEEARTKSDAKGAFTLTPKGEDNSPHLLRVTHQGVNYFRPAPPGTTSVEVEVYDAAKEVAGISGLADITRLQADNGRLDAIQMWIVKNESKPPRTQMSANTFEITLPEAAVIDSSLAAGPGGMPVNSAPVPKGEKGHYAYLFPLRPGETRFQISYHLPYSGSFSFNRQSLLPMSDVVVMLPKSVEFKPTGNDFQPSNDEKGMTVYVAKAVPASKQLAFSISGTGQIPREAQEGDAEGEQPSAAGGGSAENRPGGGLGTPIDAPDPLHKYRWWLLGGLAAALVAGAFYMMGRQQPAVTAAARAVQPNSSPLNKTAGSSSDLLVQALKEELFQLESDKIQGQISAAEYGEAKAALDLLIKRAVSRRNQVVKA
jgi:hypothetical protein